MATTRTKKAVDETVDQVEEKAKTTHEEFKLESGKILDKIKELIREGNIRRIIIKRQGKPVFEIPMTFGAVGILLAPELAAIGAFIALATDCTLEVERRA